jgi:hypothetical protein
MLCCVSTPMPVCDKRYVTAKGSLHTALVAPCYTMAAELSSCGTSAYCPCCRGCCATTPLQSKSLLCAALSSSDESVSLSLAAARVLRLQSLALRCSLAWHSAQQPAATVSRRPQVSKTLTASAAHSNCMYSYRPCISTAGHSTRHRVHLRASAHSSTAVVA